MAKSQQSFNKKEIEKKRKKKREAKLERREQRKKEKEENGPKSFEEMLSYVDENGLLTSVPPDPSKKQVIKAEDIVLGVPQRLAVATERQGTVKFFNHEKAYGFIIDKESGDSIFVHRNNLEEPIEENHKVSFEIENGPKGPSAVNVRRIKTDG